MSGSIAEPLAGTCANTPLSTAGLSGWVVSKQKAGVMVRLLIAHFGLDIKNQKHVRKTIYFYDKKTDNNKKVKRKYVAELQ